MEKDSAAATTKTKTTWSTWEELLLAFAVKRHGLKDWESVAMELQTRSSLPALWTAQICKDKYRDLRRRFMNSYNDSYDEKIIEQDVDDNGDVMIPWIEELRQLRVAELKQEVQRYDLSIQSLEMKVKEMEEDREESLKEQSLDDGQKPDLEDAKEERSQNDKNSGADAKPEDFTGKAMSSEESDRENRSFNESNSTENRETGVKNEPEPVEIGADKPVQEVKPAGEEDSYNDSSSDRQEEKKVRRDSGDLRNTVSGSKEETRENSDVQSTATLTKRKRQRGGDGGRSGGDATEMGSPAVRLKGEGAAKSEPLTEFLDIIRSHKRGSVFKRRLDSQKTDKYKSTIRQHMDLETVQARIDDGSYCSCPSKFYLDLLLIFNNAVVYFPKSSPESTAGNELRVIVMEELKRTRTQSNDPSPLKIQPKPEVERSDSLFAKHKSAVPIVVCRKRSSISAKAAVSSGNNKTEKPADSKPPLNPKPPAIKSSSNEEESSIKLGVKEKPVTGVRSMRRSSKGRSNNNASQSNSNQNTNAKQTNNSADKKEEAKPEKKKEEGKKRGAAADFLKRIKKNSPTKGTLVEALKNNPPEEVVVKGNKKEQQKKKVDERREAPVRRSSGGGGGGISAVKEEGSPSKRSVGRPPKRGGKEVVVQEKRGRDNSEKDDSSKRPKKRSRRVMVEGGAGPEFPVVFFDGEREMNIGNIRVYPLLEFKAFQLMLSQRIGISPNQISIYLCDQKSSKFEDRRRIPVTGKANFGLIAREKDCFFLVVLKRSRKSRNRKGVKSENEFPVPTLPDNLILLRRTHPDPNHIGFGSPFLDQISQLELENLNEKLQSLTIQRDNYNYNHDYDYDYSMGMSQLNSIPMHRNNLYPNPDPFPRMQDAFPMKKKAECEQCKDENGSEHIPSFHHCINDPVYVGGHRSWFGPVCRPVNFD